MLDTLFTPPWTWVVMAVGLLVAVGGAFFLRSPGSPEGKKGKGLNKKQIALFLPALILIVGPLLNPMFFHLGHATSLTGFGAGPDGSLWALDVQVSASSDSDVDSSYHYRLHILDAQTGARRDRVSVGMDASVLGEDADRLFVSVGGLGSGLLTVDKRTGAITERSSLREKLQSKGVTAEIDKIDRVGPLLRIHTKDAEAHLYDPATDALIDAVASQPKPRPRFYVTAHRLMSPATHGPALKDKVINGKVVLETDAITVVQHFRTTDNLDWSFIAMHPDGRVAWRIDEAAVFPGALEDRLGPTIVHAGELLLLSWDGHLAALELETGRLRFSVRV